MSYKIGVYFLFDQETKDALAKLAKKSKTSQGAYLRSMIMRASKRNDRKENKP